MPLESTQDAVVQRHTPLADILWRSGGGGLSATLRGVTLVVLGTALLTLSAKINVPLPYVPITLQTLVVLVIGSVYGWRLGGLTLMAYLAEGAAEECGLSEEDYLRQSA